MSLPLRPGTEARFLQQDPVVSYFTPYFTPISPYFHPYSPPILPLFRYPSAREAPAASARKFLKNGWGQEPSGLDDASVTGGGGGQTEGEAGRLSMGASSQLVSEGQVLSNYVR